MFGTLLIGLSSLSGSADAAELRWSWEGPKSYFIRADVRLNDDLYVMSRKNLEARANEFVVQLKTTCEPTLTLRDGRRWEVECSFDEVSLLARPRRGDRVGVIGRIMEEWSTELESDLFMRLVLTEDGRLVQADLQGKQGRNPRTMAIRATQREVMMRAFAGFEVPLPRSGFIEDGKAWIRYGVPQSQRFVSVFATAGMMELYGQARRFNQQVIIETEGIALLNQERLGSFQGEQLGAILWDEEHGEIIQRRYETLADPLPSNYLFQATPLIYAQSVTMTRVEADASLDLPPSGEKHPRASDPQPSILRRSPGEGRR